MNTPPAYSVGPHVYRLHVMGPQDGELVPIGSPTTTYLEMEYCLFHANGMKGKPEPGKPNAKPWRMSRHRWPNDREGIVRARKYAETLLRPGERNRS